MSTDLGFKLFEMAQSLIFAADNYKTVLDVSITKAAEIVGSERCCIIIQNLRNEMVLKAGLPADRHGMDQKITNEFGESFLRQIAENGRIVLINNPISNPKTDYIRELAKQYSISSILYVPLYNEHGCIGIMIFDRVNGRTFSLKDVERAKAIVCPISIAIAKEYNRREKYQEMKRLERLAALGENSARIAHTMRNKLTSIIGFTRRILKSRSSEEINDYAGIVIKDAKRLDKITKDVLIFSVISAKQPERARCYLNEFLRTTVKKFTSFNNNDIRVKLQLDSHLEIAKVFFDKRMFEICLNDILQNAAEASAKKILIKSKLKLGSSLKKNNKKVLISVANNGDEIPENMLDKIFDPFMSFKPDGTGLGLANTKAVIEIHKGEIFVESREGKTKFKIYLPF